MANYKISFLSTERSLIKTQIICNYTIHNEIFICIEKQYDNEVFQYVCLDKSTAIKLAKTLRTEINKMEDTNNG